MQAATLDRVFSALADPTRRGILSRLKQGPTTVGDLAAPYAVSKSAISQHLRVLETAGLIERTTTAQWRTCTLRTEPLDEVAAWVDEHRAIWNGRFDQLEEHLRHLKGQNSD